MTTDLLGVTAEVAPVPPRPIARLHFYRCTDCLSICTSAKELNYYIVTTTATWSREENAERVTVTLNISDGLNVIASSKSMKLVPATTAAPRRVGLTAPADVAVRTTAAT